MGITFGLALPWIICIVIRWVCENTTIGGKQLAFKGTGGGLFGRSILWSLLTIITLGIYGYWAIRNCIRWAIENIEVNLPNFSSGISSNNIPRNALKCNNCNKTFSSGYTSCPYCASKDIEYITQVQNQNYVPINNPVIGDTWVCKKCGEDNRSASSSCKGCGAYR
jgi:hypothetical protein